MVEPKEVAYINEGPQVVLRRMRRAGLSHIFVVNEERRLIGMAEVEDVARLAERGERELRAAVDTSVPEVERGTWLRDILPLFVERDVPVPVVDEDERLKDVIVRGSLIAGLTTSIEQPNGSDITLKGERHGDATLQGSDANQETNGKR